MGCRVLKYSIVKLASLVKFTSILFIFCLTACSSNNMYHGGAGECGYVKKGDCANSAIEVHNQSTEEEYRLGFVEYDDQGQLRSPQQMATVLDRYRSIAGGRDVLLITFVHGWHHNAAHDDSNIAEVRKLLATLAHMETIGSKQQNRKPREILGAYVGWRGESVEIPYVNILTFWERKNTAHKVGQQGVTELLLKFEEIVNVKVGTETEIPPPANSRFVVIGHSFGGAVVYGALQNVLTDRFINSQRGKTFQSDANGFGDLVLLVNPAFEAIRFSPLYDLSQEECRGYLPSQLPKLAILTSEADLATKTAFPAGRFFSTLFDNHVNIDRHYCNNTGQLGIQALTIPEGSADRTAVGHYRPYLTHRLNPSADHKTRSEAFSLQSLQINWENQNQGERLSFEGTNLESLNRTTPRNPFLNIQLDKHISNGHNDIWQPDLMNFVRDLILIATTPTDQK